MNSDEEISYHATDENYGEYEEQSYVYHETGDVDDSTTYSDVVSKKKRNKNIMNDDPGHKIIGNKYDKFEYYAGSMLPGASIRNAVTGIREYNLKVGSWNDESQFFKVRYAGNYSTNNPDVLYYDSPEQAERHMKSNINQTLKNKWQKRYEYVTRPVNSQ